AQDMDQYYFIYQAARAHCPEVLKGREGFAAFLPWAQEILSFIEQLDLECVDNERLLGIEQNAAIGYEVPQDINRLLQHVVILRQAYHDHMKATRVFSRGMQYLTASQAAQDCDLSEFDEVLFANFFYFNRAEESVVKALYQQGRARLFFQGDERRWPVFERIARVLGTEIIEGKTVAEPAFNLKLYEGFDAHSQICQIREIIKTIDRLDKTVIVLSNPDAIIPLLSQIGPVVKDFNISMGYPLKRSSLISLMEHLFAAQQSRDNRGYYTQDYLNVLKHPLVKNLKFEHDPQVTRILIHKIEEVMTGLQETPLSGCVFITLKDVTGSEEIFELAKKTLSATGISVSVDQLKETLKRIHEMCFEIWEPVSSFAGFSQCLERFLTVVIEKSFLEQYPLNIRIAVKLFDIAEECAVVDFSHEPFKQAELFKIFMSRIEREIVAFIGSPLKGLQLLGLFETRSLNFDHVIVMDVNEGALPRLNLYQPLIPRDVMISLNLDRLEQEEEIQRYGFMRLISSAKNVHLIYQQSRDKERSRFIEELVWQGEKKAHHIGVVPVARVGFEVRAQRSGRVIEKTPAMIEMLRSHRYSASSINLYLRNPLEFCYRYVFGLQEQDDLLDEPENRQVGTFLHQLLEQTFKGFVNKKPVVDQAFIRYVQGAFEKEFEKTFSRTRRSDIFFLKHVMDQRLARFLEQEAVRCREEVDQILFIEQAFEETVHLPAGDFKFVYKVDRVDRLRDGTILLLDYKTGSTELMPKSLEEVEAVAGDREGIAEVVRSFQLPLYFHYLYTSYPGQEIDAGLYSLRDGRIHCFMGRRTGSDYGRVDQVFLNALNVVMKEILDPSIPFVEGD
ncbi:MAG TPA: PD-(D/E)XK nuclease family protein, partial [Candidatus Bathyarchaeia archaeon]|nr:PD-(D/E)XK nuclease family protein [Candidatus Bathyarchaeia archaeon]